MTLAQALLDLKAKNKPYIDIMPQGTFANTIKAIEYGFAKPKTIQEFMGKFGYKKVEIIEQWEKK